jgi:hypothetical protein
MIDSGPRNPSPAGNATRAGGILLVELLLQSLERVEHARRVRDHNHAGVGEAAGAAVAFDQLLAQRALERLQMLGRRRLADLAHLGRGGDRAAAVDLDQQPQSRGIEGVNYAGRERHLSHD